MRSKASAPFDRKGVLVLRHGRLMELASDESHYKGETAASQID